MIVWIASYPKSGNTWVRSFLSSYVYNGTKKFNFNDLDKIRAFPSDPEINFLRKKYGRYKFTDMCERWDEFQKAIIKTNKYTFLKTHNACITINGNNFSNLENCLGLIYIVRDPRDVALSYSSHLNFSIEDTYKAMTNANLVEKTTEGLDRTLITSWNNHYNSWKNFPKKKIIIKYENLIDKPEDTFFKIIKYLNEIIGLKIDKNLIKNCVNDVSFEKLKTLEKNNGFIENKSPVKNHKFFNIGKKNQWKLKLNENLINKFINNFESEMKELKYI